MPHQFLHFGTAGEGRRAGQQVEEGAAQAIQVGTNGDPPRVACLFRRDEIGCAQQCAGPRQWGLRQAGDMLNLLLKPGQPHIEDLEDPPIAVFAVADTGELLVALRDQRWPLQQYRRPRATAAGGPHRHQQIRRLDVAMNQAHLVRVLQPLRGLPNVVACLFDGPRPGESHQLLERHAVDILHRQIMHAFDFVEVEDDDDVGMVELGDGLGFALEARDDLRLRGQHGRSDDLDGHDALQAQLNGLVDVAHPALANLLQKAEWADDKSFTLPFEQELLLKWSQPPASDKIGRELVSGREPIAVPSDRFNLAWVQQLAPAEERQQLVRRGYGHADFLPAWYASRGREFQSEA